MTSKEELNSAILKAKDELNAHRPVALPTETVYGLAAPVFDELAISEVFHLKRRPLFDPLIAHVCNMEQLKQLTPVYDSQSIKILSKTFWPGPLTLVVPKLDSVPDLVTAGHSSIGIRMPDNEIFLSCVRTFGAPLAAPSANLFGKTSPTSADHVRQSFPDAHLHIIDGGNCKFGIESTVVSLLDEKAPSILRPGYISAQQISDALDCEVKTQNSESKKMSPGHLENHYQPDIPLIIIDSSLKRVDNFIGACLQQINENCNYNLSHPLELSLEQEPEIAARYLYAKLRELSSQGGDCIYVLREKKYADPLWHAIWDRILKSSSYEITAL